MIDEFILKMVDNTPVLALLAMHMYHSIKLQEKRDSAIAKERQQFLEAYQTIANELSFLSKQLKKSSRSIAKMC